MALDGLLSKVAALAFAATLSTLSTLSTMSTMSAASLPSAVKPFPSGLSGRLVFESDREGRTKIYSLDLATGTVGKLTNGDWRDEHPRWSPDGRLIAFFSDRANRKTHDIYVMDEKGSSVRRLTRFGDDAANVRNDRNARDPIWAADGKSVFFNFGRDRSEEIYRVWIDNGKVEPITDVLTRAIMPSASPDGRYLAYAVQSILKLGAFQIVVKDLRTGETRDVSTSGGACRPAWSPDSSQISYVLLDEEPSGIESWTLATNARRRIVSDKKLWSYYPAWSPDGRYVAFSVSPEHHEGEDWDLAFVDLTRPGSLQRLTIGGGNDRLPHWRR